jgi:hypothetical protein
MKATAFVALGILAVLIWAMPGSAQITNDEQTGAIPLQLDVPLDFDSTGFTMSASDPMVCNGSHGLFPGPYYASAWFKYTAKASDNTLFLSAKTDQGDPKDFYAITFVFEQTANGLQQIDCTAYGNEASWKPTKGTTYLIMEAGLDESVTGDPNFSNKGGHGTLVLSRTSGLFHPQWTWQGSYSDCGFPVNWTETYRANFRLKPGRQGDPTPYWFENYEFHAVTTNPANGKWFVEDGNGLYKDLHITKAEGTVHTFVATEVGRPYTLTDMNGNKLFFDRGRVLITFQVDTLGDDNPYNDVDVPDSFQVLAANGSHLAYFWGGDWCEDIVIPLLGGDK